MIVLHIDPIDTIVTGIKYGSPLEAEVNSAMSYFVPDYDKTEAFQLGHWDGKKYLLSKLNPKHTKYGIQHQHQATHCFPTGLVNRLLKLLKQYEFEYQIQYKRPMKWEPDPTMDFMKTVTLPMRDYQTGSYMSLTKDREGRLGGTLEAATGAGKTRVAAKLFQHTRVKGIMLVNTKDLLYQAIDEFKQCLGIEIGQIGDGVVNIQPITVATVQTVCRAFGITVAERTREELESAHVQAIREFCTAAKLVIFDECHTVAADTVYECSKVFKNQIFAVGLSASPWRDDGMELLIEAACGPVVFRVSASDLIDRGILVPPQIIACMLPLPYVITKDHQARDWNTLTKAWMVEDNLRNSFISQLAEDFVKIGRVVLVLVNRIEHGKILQRMIPKSEFLNGKLTATKRKKLIAQTRSKELLCIMGTSIADQGLDIPAISVIIMAGGGKSSTRTLQRIGRGLRQYPGKDDCLVYDIVDNHETMQMHFLERKSLYKRERRFELLDVKINYEDFLNR